MSTPCLWAQRQRNTRTPEAIGESIIQKTPGSSEGMCHESLTVAMADVPAYVVTSCCSTFAILTKHHNQKKPKGGTGWFGLHFQVTFCHREVKAGTQTASHITSTAKNSEGGLLVSHHLSPSFHSSVLPALGLALLSQLTINIILLL